MTAGLLEYFRFDSMPKKINQVVHVSSIAAQSLSEILMIVFRAPHTPLRCEVFKVMTQAGIILDIDIPGLQNHD